MTKMKIRPNLFIKIFSNAVLVNDMHATINSNPVEIVKISDPDNAFAVLTNYINSIDPNDAYLEIYTDFTRVHDFDYKRKNI